MGLRPPSMPLATKTSLGTSLGETVGLQAASVSDGGSPAGLFPRPGRQVHVTLHVKLMDWEWPLDCRVEKEP